jgi:hypothetical protein
MSYEDCEGIAQHELDRLGLGGHIDAWDIVAGYEGVSVEWGVPGGRPHLEDHGNGRFTIVVDRTERHTRVQLALLHELAHVLLDVHGVKNDDEHAWWLGCALLLPREDVLRARRRGATVARRLVALSTSAVLWVHDVEPRYRDPYRVVSPGWRWSLHTPSPLEHEAMTEAFAARRSIEVVGGVRAWVAIDEPWVRVLCLSDAEVLLPTIAPTASP